MKQLTFYFDPISPYAALAFERLPEVLQGLSYSVDYRPILFASLLKAGGNKGPAEIPGKREWTYRQVLWEAQRLGLPLQLPAAHPFNPLGLLRLCWATALPGQGPSRHVVEQVMRHVWRGGASAADPERLGQLAQALGVDPEADAAKARLREASDEALTRGVFGVPTVAVDDKLFWGLDSLDMLSAYLRGHDWFAGPDWEAAAALKPDAAIKRPAPGAVPDGKT